MEDGYDSLIIPGQPTTKSIYSKNSNWVLVLLTYFEVLEHEKNRTQPIVE